MLHQARRGICEGLALLEQRWTRLGHIEGYASESGAKLFDRVLKRAHRGRSAYLVKADDPLLSTVSERLLDRLEDCVRKFPTAVILGGTGLHVARGLMDGRAGIEKVLHLDLSEDMLKRAEGESQALRAAGHNVPSTQYLVADEDQLLPLEPNSVDCSDCQLPGAPLGEPPAGGHAAVSVCSEA